MLCRTTGKSKGPSTLAIASRTTHFVLEALDATAGRLDATVSMQEAAGLARRLYEMVEIQPDGLKGDMFQELANDVCALVYIFLYRDKTSAVSKDTDNHEALAKTIREIHYYTKTHASRSNVARVMQRKSDDATIQMYRDRLRNSLGPSDPTLSIQGILVSVIQHKFELLSKDFRLGRARRQASLGAEGHSPMSGDIAREGEDRGQDGDADNAMARRADHEEKMPEPTRLQTEWVRAAETNRSAHRETHVPEVLRMPQSNHFRRRNPFSSDSHPSSTLHSGSASQSGDAHCSTTGYHPSPCTLSVVPCPRCSYPSRRLTSSPIRTIIGDNDLTYSCANYAASL
ncbi:hypothetical protein FPV67DRAFT_116486 [Lyophyllum atratum]|nr:hypothetical protein FPV67DRAFT_116486 [Lyophyllum atratum]